MLLIGFFASQPKMGSEQHLQNYCGKLAFPHIRSPQTSAIMRRAWYHRPTLLDVHTLGMVAGTILVVKSIRWSTPRIVLTNGGARLRLKRNMANIIVRGVVGWTYRCWSEGLRINSHRWPSLFSKSPLKKNLLIVSSQLHSLKRGWDSIIILMDRNHWKCITLNWFWRFCRMANITSNIGMSNSMFCFRCNVMALIPNVEISVILAVRSAANWAWRSNESMVQLMRPKAKSTAHIQF